MTEFLFLKNSTINVDHIVVIEKTTVNQYGCPGYRIVLKMENYRRCPITEDIKLFNTKEIWYFEGNVEEYSAITEFIDNKKKEYISKASKNEL
jgi:hypothetical protein